MTNIIGDIKETVSLNIQKCSEKIKTRNQNFLEKAKQRRQCGGETGDGMLAPVLAGNPKVTNVVEKYRIR